MSRGLCLEKVYNFNTSLIFNFVGLSMSHIFISYSHTDKDYVHKLQEALQNEGFEVWIDDRIDYGTVWPKVIQNQLDTSDALILVMSPRSFESFWVQNELERAREDGIPIFPLLLEGRQWLSVQTLQYADVRDKSLPPEKFYKQLEEVTPRKKVERGAYAKPVQDKAEHDTAQKKPAEEHLLPTDKSSIPLPQSTSMYKIRPLEVLGIFLLMAVCFVAGISILNAFLPSTHTSTTVPTETNRITASQIPPKTFVDSPLPTETLTPEPPTITPSPTLGISSNMMSPKDGMALLYVPAGNFLMGSADSGPEVQGNEKPQHTVYLDASLDRPNRCDQQDVFFVRLRWNLYGAILYRFCYTFKLLRKSYIR